MRHQMICLKQDLGTRRYKDDNHVKKAHRQSKKMVRITDNRLSRRELWLPSLKCKHIDKLIMPLCRLSSNRQ